MYFSPITTSYVNKHLEIDSCFKGGKGAFSRKALKYRVICLTQGLPGAKQLITYFITVYGNTVVLKDELFFISSLLHSETAVLTTDPL